MKRFIEGEDRAQGALLPEHLEDYVAENNPVRVIDVFVDELDLGSLGFARVLPASGRIFRAPNFSAFLHSLGQKLTLNLMIRESTANGF